MIVTHFDITTRQVVGSTQGEIFADDTPPNAITVNGLYGKDHYLDGNDLAADKVAISFTVDKQTIDADGVDQAVISGLPSGTIMTIDDDSEVETGGIITFSVDLAGTYQLTLTHSNHLNTDLTITAI